MKKPLWQGDKPLPRLNAKKQDPTHAMLLPEEDLYAEIKRREESNLFPVDVFPTRLHGWLNYLLVECGAEPSFVGTSLLQATSIAIGSGLRGRMGTMTEKLAMYSAMVGYTSSGKSFVMDNMMMPIKAIQKDLDMDNVDAENHRMEDKGADFVKNAIITEDTTYGSFIELLRQNPHGVSKTYDELSTFFDDMVRFKSINAGEDKFWLKAWNSKAEHRISRKSANDIVIPQDTLFANIFGGTQPIFLKLFFKDTRYESGFSARWLFALQPKYEIMEIDPYLIFPENDYETYATMIRGLYAHYRVKGHGVAPTIASFTRKGIDEFQRWSTKHLAVIKKIQDDTLKDAHNGIYGKMKQYVIRFAALLKAIDQACDSVDYIHFEKIEENYVKSACRIADYFMKSNYTAYEMVYKNTVVPPDVMEFFGACRVANWNISKIAETYSVQRATIRKRLMVYAKEYPNLFKN